MQKEKLEANYIWHCELYFEISVYDQAKYVKQKIMLANQTVNQQLNFKVVKNKQDVKCRICAYFQFYNLSSASDQLCIRHVLKSNKQLKK
jgi:hypothetical protein